MNLQILRPRKYKNLKGFLGSTLTLMLILQIFTPGVFAISNAQAADKVDICHNENNWHLINVAESAVPAHMAHGDFLYTGPAGEGTDEWCANNAPEVPPGGDEDIDTGTLTVTKMVVGTSTPASDFDLFVNGMPIVSGVASTSIAVGSYTITEENDARFEASFSGDCNAQGVVHIEDEEDASCTITNTWVGGTGGAGGEGTFKVKILKYLDGTQATADSANNASFPFHSSWDWTDGNGNHNGSGDFNIDQNGGIGGAPAYQAWTADMKAPADYSVNEVVGGDILASDAQCAPGKYKLQGYKTGSTLSGAQGSNISTTAPSFTDISSERYVIVYNEICPDITPTTGSLTVNKVVIGGDKEVSDFSLYLNGLSIISGVASTSVSVGTSTVSEASATDYSGTFSGDCNAQGQVYVGAGQSKICTLTNTFTGTTSGTSTSPFMVKIYKYLNGVQANATTSGNYEFPMQSSWDWTDGSGNHNGSGNFYLGLSGHGGSDPYQAFTSLMTGPADYATHEITSDIASSSSVLPAGASCQEGMFRLQGYKSGSTLAGALAGSLSTTSPSYTDISSERYIVVMNESCPDIVPNPNPTGTIVINKIVINDNGGTGTTTNFSFSLDNGSSTAFEADGSNSLVVATGTHNIVETSAAGYTTTYDGCSNINVQGGDTHTCTITNNDIAPGTTGNIIVNKIVINNNSGTSTALSFPLFVGSTSVVMGATTTLSLGTYTVSETYNPNLYAQSFSGDCNSSGSVTLSSTTTKTCTITNHDIPQFCPATSGYIESDTNTTVGTSSAVLLSFVHPAWTADVDGASTTAKWIWSTNPVATTTATTTVMFNRTFTVVGSSTDATLNLASDNTYRVWINGNLVGASTDGDNFRLATQDSYDVSNFLVNGTNTIAIEVTNEPTPNITDPQTNPAGLLYSLTWVADNCPVNNGGQGGDNGGTDNTVTTNSTSNSNKTRHRTIVRGINSSSNNNPSGQVLGINTENLVPLGQVLGINSTLPGLPSTGLGPVVEKAANSSAFPILLVGLLALGGLYVLQFRIFRKR